MKDSRIRADDKTFEGFTFVEESQIARRMDGRME